MRILMITSEWPTTEHPGGGAFIFQRVKYLREAGIEVKVFSFRGQGNPINYMRAWMRLHRRYNLEDFDLIDVQFGQSGLIAVPSKVPLVVTFWGSDLYGIVSSRGRYTLKGLLLRYISRFIANQASKIIVVSKHMIKFLPPRLSIHVIPSGIDTDLFSPLPHLEARNRLNLPKDKYLVLFVGNPNNPVKRHYLAKKAVELVKEKYNVELITIFNVSHNLVPIYMNACDVLVLTSKHEGSPTVVKEALACNLPVLSVDVGDVRERIANIEGCVLCSDDKLQTIADALIKVLKEHKRINGSNVVKDFDERILVEKVIDVYRSALWK